MITVEVQAQEDTLAIPPNLCVDIEYKKSPLSLGLIHEGCAWLTCIFRSFAEQKLVLFMGTNMIL